MKVSLVRAFGWSLPEIAASDMESLFGFMQAYMDEAPVGRDDLVGVKRKKKVYCDQVAWL